MPRRLNECIRLRGDTTHYYFFNIFPHYLGTDFFEIIIIHSLAQSQIVIKISSSYDHPFWVLCFFWRSVYKN
jgi:hypothetical protein